MKLLISILAILISFAATGQQQYDRFGFHSTTGLAVSPSHPSVFANVGLGVHWQSFEIAGTIIPQITDQGYSMLTFTAGYRFQMAEKIVFTPVLGYWAGNYGQPNWQWTGGNRMIYGGDVERRLDRNTSLVVSFRDGRAKNNNLSSINTLKLCALSIRYHL